jgi:hypothetical protein
VIHTEDITKLAAALIKAQTAFKPAIKESTNPAFKSKYVDLAGVIEATRHALNSNGLCVIQGATGSPETATVNVTTRLLHESGQWIEETLTLPAVGRDGATAQSFGSATTYGRRYGYMAMVGIAPEDDDGQSASAPMPPSAATLATQNRDEWKKQIALCSVASDFNALLPQVRAETPEIRKMLADAAAGFEFVYDKTTGKFVNATEETNA